MQDDATKQEIVKPSWRRNAGDTRMAVHPESRFSYERKAVDVHEDEVEGHKCVIMEPMRMPPIC